MKLSERAEKRIRKIIENEAIGHYVCNRDDDNFPRNPLELLRNGRTETGRGKEIVIWAPYEYENPEEVAEHIEDEIWGYTKMVEKCIAVALRDVKNTIRKKGAVHEKRKQA